MPEPKTIILDTDFLVFCAEHKIDYVTELNRVCDFPFTIVVLDKTLHELESVAAKSAKNAIAVKLAKTILQKKKLAILPTNKNKPADALILQFVNEHFCVATQDKKFKEKARAKGACIITVRQKKYLIME